MINQPPSKDDVEASRTNVEDYLDAAPAPDRTPALPQGWRLASHRVFGRGIVTTPEADCDGKVWFVRPVGANLKGCGWCLCNPDLLTFHDAAPALPQWWRLATHPVFGRGIVTTAEVDCDGGVWFLRPDSGDVGWCFCDPDSLTFLDGTTPDAQEEA